MVYPRVAFFGCSEPPDLFCKVCKSSINEVNSLDLVLTHWAGYI